MPSNAEMAIQAFRVIALGEFIPFEWMTEPLKELTRVEETEDGEAEQGDADKSNVIANMGVMLVILAIFLVVILLICFIVGTCKKGSCCHRLGQKLKAKIFWNGLLRYVLQSYLKISMSCLMALSVMKWDELVSSINSGLGLLMLAVLLCQPVLFACIMERNVTKLRRRKMKA